MCQHATPFPRPRISRSQFWYCPKLQVGQRCRAARPSSGWALPNELGHNQIFLQGARALNLRCGDSCKEKLFTEARSASLNLNAFFTRGAPFLIICVQLFQARFFVARRQGFLQILLRWQSEMRRGNDVPEVPVAETILWTSERSLLPSAIVMSTEPWVFRSFSRASRVRAAVFWFVLLGSVANLQASSVVAWGRNQGNVTNTPPDLTNVVAIAAGNAYILALDANGIPRAWGDNTFGQTNVPAGVANVAAISGGGIFSPR